MPKETITENSVKPFRFGISTALTILALFGWLTYVPVSIFSEECFADFLPVELGGLILTCCVITLFAMAFSFAFLLANDGKKQYLFEFALSSMMLGCFVMYMFELI
jgi:hypothetical protein